MMILFSRVLLLFFLNFPVHAEDLDDYGNSSLLGDMILDSCQLNHNSSNSTESNFKLWPNSTVIYHFDDSINQDEATKKNILEAMHKIENASCIRFQPKTEESIHYVVMKKGKICSSKVGFRKNGTQPLFIDENCGIGSIVHELLHTLSFLHMHTAKNRDDFIEINWDNIKNDSKANFEIFPAPNTLLNAEYEYDYESIMHYSNYAFAKNKLLPTIVGKNSEKSKNMGQRKELSSGDVLRLNRLYKCPGFDKITSKESISTTESPSKESTESPTQESSESPPTESTEANVDPKVNLTALEDDVNDMMLTQEQIDSLYSTNSAKRNGLKSAFHHWPNGIVSYEIDSSFSPKFVATIEAAMNYITNRSCVRFATKTIQTQNYIFITKGPGCSSEVGMRRTGKQLMNINERLCPRGKIIHEILHALGFLHMHTANERDMYLKVNWPNIKEQAKFNFKQFVAHVSMFKTPYDYQSIMHYSPTAFAKNKKKLTLIPINSENSGHMGQREGMSIGDIVRLNRMYKCGAPYISSMPEASTAIKSSNESTSKNIPKRNRSIFGVFIFKSIDQGDK